MRIFLGIKIPDSLCIGFEELRKKLRENNYRTVPKGKTHITIKFYGEIQEKQLEKIIMKVKELDVLKFKILVKGVGAFPSVELPKIFWCGVESKELIRLGTIFQKNYKPHLTLGRLKNNKKIKEIKKLLEEYKNKNFGEFLITEIIVFKSTLKPDGPVYEELYEKHI